MQKTLDIAIRDSEGKEGGYVIGKKKYENYMTNQAWVDFLKEMEDKYNNVYESYKNGGGKELLETQYPPKMASFGSSSRFIYMLARDIKGFEFEKQFETKIGGTSNLDGFLNLEDRSVCVEAKCREPYGSSHEEEERSEVYRPLLEYLSENCEDLNFEISQSKENKIAITSRINGVVIKHFDIIQLICHFCGMANHIQELRENITFIYLIFNPTNVTSNEKISPRYKDTIEEMKRIDLENLFITVTKYFNIPDMEKYEFIFKIEDQDTFHEALDSIVSPR